jgi:hypothetical protein
MGRFLGALFLVACLTSVRMWADDDLPDGEGKKEVATS